VESVNILSPEELAARQANDARQRQDAANREQLEKQRRQAEGEQIKVNVQSDPAFAALPAEAQVSYWVQFQSQYPGVNAVACYAAAVSRAQREKTQESLRVQQMQAAQQANGATQRVQAASETIPDGKAVAYDALQLAIADARRAALLDARSREQHSRELAAQNASGVMIGGEFVRYAPAQETEAPHACEVPRGGTESHWVY